MATSNKKCVLLPHDPRPLASSCCAAPPSAPPRAARAQREGQRSCSCGVPQLQGPRWPQPLAPRAPARLRARSGHPPQQAGGTFPWAVALPPRTALPLRACRRGPARPPTPPPALTPSPCPPRPRSLQKIIILGAQGVGKTSLMERFVAAKFNSQYKATIGADFSTKDVVVGDEVVTLQIWDTAGQERYQSLGTAFYRGADACVLVYDVSEAASFAKLETWRTTFIQSADIKDAKDFPFVVLGNKSDMEQAKQVVLPGAVQEWCAKMGRWPAFLIWNACVRSMD